MEKTPYSLCVVGALVFFTAIFAGQAATNLPGANYVEGDVIVTFKSSIGTNAAQQILSGRSLGWRKRFGELSRRRGKQTGLVHSKNKTTAQLIVELSQNPDVETAEPNYLRTFSARQPDDPLFGFQWALDNTGQSVNATTGTVGDDIHFVSAWGLSQTSPTNPPVAVVIDSGVDYTHPDLAGNMWVNTGEIPGNGKDDDGDGYVDDYYGYDFADNLPSPMDSGYHGTHVAGIIAAVGNNSLGVIGVNYHARIMALRASSDGENLSDAAIIEAIQYAILKKNSGVNIVVINESFGGSGYNSAEYAAMQAAGNVGIIFCVAAGNNTNDNDTTPMYPASYGLSNEIVVAATDQNDTLASFSNYGASSVDIGAPGGNVLSTLPVAVVTNSGLEVFSTVEQGGTQYSANDIKYSGISTGLTAKVYYCGLGNPSEFPAAVSNNIALIQRGTLTFASKVANAMSAGARAAIIYNNVSGNFLGTLGGPAPNWIPAVSVSLADGQAIQTNATATIIHGLYQYLDGTSMATPQVSGAVTFAAMNFPNETVTQRIQRVLGNADVLPGLAGVVRTGARLNLQRIVDTDTNGLPDWWELAYFGQLTGINSNADPDHDGVGNFAEWIAGTNPTNAASVLKLAASEATAANAVLLSWPSVAGKIYRLEKSTDLASGFNFLVMTNIAATPPTNTLADPAALSGGSQFYRVEVEQ